MNGSSEELRLSATTSKQQQGDVMSTCDKCGEEVPMENDAAYLEVLMGNYLAVVAESRHLLPTENCEGSPSRAQYIEGQPKDKRGYTYYQFAEYRIRSAYELMQSHNYHTLSQ